MAKKLLDYSTDVSMKAKVRWAKMDSMIEAAEKIVEFGNKYKDEFTKDNDGETAEQELGAIYQEMYYWIGRLNMVRPSDNS